MKLLVNAPTGQQELIEVGEGGGYFDASRVLWDERDDGPIPEITLGGMVRAGGALTFDQARMDGHVAEAGAVRKDAKWSEIKAERDRRKAAGVKVATHWFHSDDASRIQQLGLVIMGASIPVGLQWKTMSGEFVPMTQALAGQVFAAAAASDQAIFSKAEWHKAQMELSADPAAYDLSAGWPLAYGE